jgi:predicted membrane GTPase involved in stress response
LSSPPITFITVSSSIVAITLQVREITYANRYVISSLGQLHLTVLIFELEAGLPVVINKINKETEKKEEPFRMVEVWVPEEYPKSATNPYNNRKGTQQDMGLDDNEDNMRVIKYLFPMWGMLELLLEVLSAT